MGECEYVGSGWRKLGSRACYLLEQAFLSRRNVTSLHYFELIQTTVHVTSTIIYSE